MSEPRVALALLRFLALFVLLLACGVGLSLAGAAAKTAAAPGAGVVRLMSCPAGSDGAGPEQWEPR